MASQCLFCVSSSYPTNISKSFKIHLNLPLPYPLLVTSCTFNPSFADLWTIVLAFVMFKLREVLLGVNISPRASRDELTSNFILLEGRTVIRKTHPHLYNGHHKLSVPLAPKVWNERTKLLLFKAKSCETLAYRDANLAFICAWWR